MLGLSVPVPPEIAAGTLAEELPATLKTVKSLNNAPPVPSRTPATPLA